MSYKKLVLVSESGYDEKHDSFLESLLSAGYELFSVVGADCRCWENVMDELAVGDGTNSTFIITTSHPGETEADVIEFAKRCWMIYGVDSLTLGSCWNHLTNNSNGQLFVVIFCAKSRTKAAAHGTAQ